MSKQHFKIGKGVNLSPVTTRPSDPENGDMIYNSTNSQFEKYANGVWDAITSDDKIGSLKYAPTAPTADYLAPNQILTKATYPTLSTQLGDLPDVPLQTTISGMAIPSSNFQQSTSSGGGAINFIATNGSIYVGVAGSSIFTSTDGIFWTARPSGIASTINSVIFANSLFVVVSNNGTIVTSTDGITWTVRPVPPHFSAAPIVTSAAFGAGLWVVVGSNGYIITSPDGITWTQQSTPLGGGINFNTVIFGGTTFVVGTSNNTRFEGVLYSTDGVNWTVRTLTVSTSVSNLSYQNSLFILIAGTALYSSTDGITWTLRNTFASVANSLVYNASLSLYIAGVGTTVTTSPDLITWTTRATSPGSVLCVANLTTGLVAVGSLGAYLTSTNGIAWTQRFDQSIQTLNYVFGFGDNYVILGVNQSVSYVSGTRYVIGGGASGATNTPASSPHGFMSAFSGTRLVSASASTGSIYTTTDGIAWSLVSNQTVNATNSVAYLNGQFLCAANATVCTSADGVTWVNRQTITGGAPISWAFGNSIYVLGGTSGIIWTSPDGITWTQRTSNMTGTVMNIIFDATLNLFLAIGQTGNSCTSPDGITWTVRGSFPSNFVKYNGSLAVTVGNSGNIFTSPDLTNWTSRVSTTTQTLHNVEFANSMWVAVGNNGTIVTSTDAITWVVRVSQTTGTQLSHVMWDGTKWIVAGGSALLTSTDGITWVNNWNNTISAAFNKTWNVFGGYVNTGTGTVLANFWNSADGFSWSSANNNVLGGSSNILSIANNGSNVFVAVGTQGALMSSLDSGVSWTMRTLATSNNMTAIIYANSKFVAVGNSGLIYTSTDGITWTNRSSKHQSSFVDVVWTGTQFVAMCQNTFVSTSPDGDTWTSRAISVVSSILSMAFGNSRFVAIGGTGGLVSTDAVNWTPVAPGTNLSTIAFGNGLFVACGGQGIVTTSTDGITWNTQTISGESSLQSIFYDGSHFYIFSAPGNVYVSTNGETWYFLSARLAKSTINLANIVPTNARPMMVNDTIYLPTVRPPPIAYGDPIVKLSRRSYNTGTQFFLPPLGAVNQSIKSWIKARLNGVG